MPLLMIDPAEATPAAEADSKIQPDSAKVLDVRRGQLLSIEAPEGGQVAALYAWAMADAAEWLSPHHTRVFGGTFVLRMGTRMVTNRRRPMFVVGRDSLRRHDLLLPASEQTVVAVRDALQARHIDVPSIPDPINLFLDAALTPDGRIDIHPCPARPGERWTARVLIDAHVAVSGTPSGVAEASARPPRSLRVVARNRVADLDPDLSLSTDSG
jgi:uncharacterized protein YcgI (DUF1989 family)